MITIEKRLQIRSQKLIAYTKFTGYHFRTEAQRKSAALLERYSRNEHEESVKTYSGEMKAGSRKRLIKAIENLVRTVNDRKTFVHNPETGKQMPFRLAFTTLTIHSPERDIDGKEAYKTVLAPMLQWLRRSHNVYLYIWKAELQERGQLHYHLLLGSFIPKDALRAKWNKLQKEAGYLDEYFDAFGDYDAPSTEIKNTIEKADLAGYLIKEISKERQNERTINGKVWDCSVNLKELGYFEVDADKYAGSIQGHYNSGNLYIGYHDRSCTVYKVKEGVSFKPKQILVPLDRWLYDEDTDYIKNTDYEKTKKPPKLKPVPYEDLYKNVPRQQVIETFDWDLFNSTS